MEKNKVFKIEDLFDSLPFSLERKEKEELYIQALNYLTKHHYYNCLEYKKILDVLKFNIDLEHKINKIPPLPVRLFKKYTLQSVDKEKIIKTMTSSGTSGQNVSKIYLDKSTATNQTKVLSKILAEFIGKKRLPMLVIDTKAILKDRKSFSARGAGILGFSMFGHDVTYALDENMKIDFDSIEKFLQKHKGKDILVFGFTSIIWEHFHKILLNNSDKKINIDNGILIHGGGWKKLQNESVDSMTFRKLINKSCGIKKIHNYYGMIEQTGSIFMECESGYLHCSNYSDIDIVNNDFEICEYNEVGLVKLYSLLPYSYPGHIILTEDLGEIIGEDNCTCGRNGKYFKIHGRVKNAEIRGCSDTYESK
jgi:phenylacetate-coenzyme A ligase PaaK-like adenylate-forming protein